MALKIFLHTIRMIFANLGQALRASVGPYLILIVVVVGLLMSSGASGLVMGDPANMALSPAVGLLPLLLLPLFLFVTSWVAVSWHRFILLEEYAGLLPQVSGRPIWPYAGKVILLGLLIFLCAIPIMLVLSFTILPFASQEMLSAELPATAGDLPRLTFLTLASFALAGVLISFLSLRWGIALVGSALGKPMGFGEAWRVTKPIASTVFGVAVLLILLNVIPELILGPIFSIAPLIGSVFSLVLSWLTMMMGISVLTTLYGHVVEGRPLVS